MYQNGAERSYLFEVTDMGGFYLAHCDRTKTTGTQFSATKVSQSITNLVYFNNSGNYTSGVNSSKFLDVNFSIPSGWLETSGTLKDYVLIDDSYDYVQKPATVSTSSLISSTGATASYLKDRSYKIYATVCFTEKEKDDGYQYIHIVAGNASASYDTGYDPDGSVNNPVNSVYKVCFELSNGSDAEGKQFFPHRYSYANKTAENNAGIGITEFSQTNGHLWQHKFKSGYQASSSGSLIFDADVENITTRFDAGGKNDDTWGYKDLFVRMALVDATAPTIITINDIKVAGGIHGYGNMVYVSVPFKEIVTVSGTPKLNTTWGELSYTSGSGSNVLTFTGEITANVGTSLTVSSISGIRIYKTGSTNEDECQGLFGMTASGSMVKNIVLYDINIVGKNKVAALVVSANGTRQDCYIYNARAHATSGSSYGVVYGTGTSAVTRTPVTTLNTTLTTYPLQRD